MLVFALLWQLGPRFVIYYFGHMLPCVCINYVGHVGILATDWSRWDHPLTNLMKITRNGHMLQSSTPICVPCGNHRWQGTQNDRKVWWLQNIPSTYWLAPIIESNRLFGSGHLILAGVIIFFFDLTGKHF